MKYEVTIERAALKALQKIPTADRDRITRLIEGLAENPRPAGVKKLTGRNGWRARMGDYRVIYEIKDRTCHILVLDVGHRKDIYH